MVRPSSAKALCVGSIPTRASRFRCLCSKDLREWGRATVSETPTKPTRGKTTPTERFHHSAETRPQLADSEEFWDRVKKAPKRVLEKTYEYSSGGYIMLFVESDSRAARRGHREGCLSPTFFRPLVKSPRAAGDRVWSRLHTSPRGFRTWQSSTPAAIQCGRGRQL